MLDEASAMVRSVRDKLENFQILEIQNSTQLGAEQFKRVVITSGIFQGIDDFAAEFTKHLVTINDIQTMGALSLRQHMGRGNIELQSFLCFPVVPPFSCFSFSVSCSANFLKLLLHLEMLISVLLVAEVVQMFIFLDTFRSPHVRHAKPLL
jgi:hypothetical protein